MAEIKSKEQLDAEQRQREHERNMAAKNRFKESRFTSVLAAPTQYNRWELKAAQDWQAKNDAEARETALRKHEVNMVEEKGAIEKDVAKINANKDVELGKLRFGYEDENGVRHEGSDVLTAQERRNAEQSKANAQLEADKYRADKDLEGKKYGADAQVDAITEKGKADLKVEQQRGNTAKEVAEISGNAQVDAAEATAAGTATAKERARQERYAQREQRDYDNWLKSAGKTMTSSEKLAFQNMSPEEQKQFWRKKTGREDAGGGGLSSFRK